MSIAFYMDVHVRSAVTRGLRQRGVDVVTAQDDRSSKLDDAQLLDRATSLGRVLFSQDHDLLREANSRQQNGIAFTGVVYAHQIKITIGKTIDDLELIAKAYEPVDIESQVEYLPL